MKQIKPQDWHRFGEWPGILILDCCSWYSPVSSSRFKELMGFGQETLVTFDKNKTEYLYFSKRFMQKLENWLEEKLSTRHGQEQLLALLKTFPAEQRKALSGLSKLDEIEWHSLDNEALALHYQEGLCLIQRITPYDQLPFVGDAVTTRKLEEYLKRELKKQGREHEAAKCLEIAATPRLFTFTQKEEEALLKTALEILDSQKTGSLNITPNEVLKKFHPQVTKLVKEFGWMPVFLFNKPWNEQDYAEELAETLLKGRAALEKKLDMLTSLPERVEREWKKESQGFEPSLLPEIMQYFVFDRNEEELTLSYGHAKLAKCYAEMAKRLGLSIGQMRFLLEDEVREFLTSGGNPAKLVQQRMEKETGFYVNEKEYSVLEKTELESIFEVHEKNRVSKEDVGKTKVLKGITASGGKASGIVHVINRLEEIHNFKSGEILVAYSTTVDYLPAMKKAAAFIAEMGGITSHTAVVAREFSTPCIVGVKGAMKLLKNGQLVTVDADKGTIKIQE